MTRVAIIELASELQL